MADNYASFNLQLTLYIIVIGQSLSFIYPQYIILHFDCPQNEEVVTCVKPKYCNTCLIRGDCTIKKCQLGCDCVASYYRNSYGECIHKSLCPSVCPPHERYSDCVNPCNDCFIKGKCNFLVCNKGCDCIKGYYRNEDRICIPESSCPAKTQCGENEKYTDCGTACPATCENKDKNVICTDQCVKGCFCDYGFVRNSDGVCVDPEQCPSETCGKNEVYQECGSSCPQKCPNLPSSQVCSTECVSGCFCRDDLVRNENNECVEISQCTANQQCGIDEQYYDCVPICNTCKIKAAGIQCKIICRKGCFCKEGFLKDENGNCVPASECIPSINTCGKNEVYQECGSSCPQKCPNLPSSQVCSTECVSGCFCRDGLVRNENNECVEISECTGASQCGPIEQYYQCVPFCNTCERYLTETQASCDIICEPGCFCRDGFLKTEDGRCVIPSQCPALTTPSPEQCGQDEEYYGCVPTCKNTCENYNQNICPLYCRPGCACKKGLVKRSDGKCVELDQCEETSMICGDNEEYSTCGTACPKTCSNLGENRVCTRECVPGCFCRDGLVRNDLNKCVEPDTCPTTPPTKKCGPNEEYSECVSSCGNTCETYNKRNIACPASCYEGCGCKKGFIRRKDGKCVKPEHCENKPDPPTKECGRGEQFYNCVPTCNNTCENYNQEHPICPLYCRQGCACKKGLVQRSDGKCVRPDQCGKTNDNCGKDEIYQECGTACPTTCSNLGQKYRICTLQCVEGCFCKKGLVRNDLNECVDPSECPKDNCGELKQYYECMPNCENQCNPPDACAQICQPGCFCKPGLVLRDDGECVEKEFCDQQPQCKPDQQYYDCMPNCGNTCKTYTKEGGICHAMCRPGCFCKPGLVLNDDNICVPPEQCPSQNECSDPTQQYYNCTPSCKNTCKHYNNPGVRCACGPPGCFCKEGLVKRESDGLCVAPEQCEQQSTCSDPNEEYYECNPSCRNTCKNYNNPLIKCACRPPGCFCREGLVKRESDGLCVAPEQCEQQTPPTTKCGPHEEYSECVSSCGTTCETYNKKNVACAYSCYRGCGCKKGYVRRKDGRCVRPENCDRMPGNNQQNGWTERESSFSWDDLGSDSQNSHSRWSSNYQNENNPQNGETNRGYSYSWDDLENNQQNGETNRGYSYSWDDLEQNNGNSQGQRGWSRYQNGGATQNKMSGGRSSSWSSGYQADTSNRDSLLESGSSSWLSGHQQSSASQQGFSGDQKSWSSGYEKGNLNSYQKGSSLFLDDDNSEENDESSYGSSLKSSAYHQEEDGFNSQSMSKSSSSSSSSSRNYESGFDDFAESFSNAESSDDSFWSWF